MVTAIIVIIILIISSPITMFLSKISNLNIDYFHIENMLSDNNIFNILIPNVQATIVSISLSILLFNAMYKLYCIYILENTGSSENPVFSILQNFTIAIIALLTYNIIFNYIIDICKSIDNDLLKVVKTSEEQIFILNIENFIQNESNLDINNLNIFKLLGINFKSITNFIPCLIIISYANYLRLKNYLTLFQKSIEIVFIRLLFPIAILGLINNDKGMLKDFLPMIIKAVLSIFIMKYFMVIGTNLLSFTNFISTIIGLSFIKIARNTPALLDMFVLPDRNGGGGNMLMNLNYGVGISKSIFKFFTKGK